MDIGNKLIGYCGLYTDGKVGKKYALPKNIYCLFGTLKMQIDLIDTKPWLVCRYIQESARLRSRGREILFGPYTRKCLNLMYGPGELLYVMYVGTVRCQQQWLVVVVVASADD